MGRRVTLRTAVVALCLGFPMWVVAPVQALDTAAVVTKTKKACTERATSVGRAAGTNELMPGGTQLRSAFSFDGQSWIRFPTPVLDQAATASLIMSPDGRPMLFSTAHQVNGKQDGFAVSVGHPTGQSWRHCRVTLKGFPAGMLGVDPDVVALPGGGYRVYLTGSAAPGSSRTAIFYADSKDGLTWTYQGVAFERPNSILDSMTFLVGDTWHMYTLSDQPAVMVHGTSKDGRTFTYVDTVPISVDGQPIVLSQAANVDGQLRVFGFLPKGMGIRSFATPVASAMPANSTLSLDLDPSLEHTFIKDPAVVQLKDGNYLMVYSTALP